MLVKLYTNCSSFTDQSDNNSASILHLARIKRSEFIATRLRDNGRKKFCGGVVFVVVRVSRCYGYGVVCVSIEDRRVFCLYRVCGARDRRCRPYVVCTQDVYR